MDSGTLASCTEYARFDDDDNNGPNGLTKEKLPQYARNLVPGTIQRSLVSGSLWLHNFRPTHSPIQAARCLWVPSANAGGSLSHFCPEPGKQNASLLFAYTVLRLACELLPSFRSRFLLMHLLSASFSCVQVACGEQHVLARVLPSSKNDKKKPPSRSSSGSSNSSSSNSLDQQAELYVWGGGRLGQVSIKRHIHTERDDTLASSFLLASSSQVAAAFHSRMISPDALLLCKNKHVL